MTRHTDILIVVVAVVALIVIVGALAWRYLAAREYKPGHRDNPSYPEGSPFYDEDEQFCEECLTLCTDDRLCGCCHVDELERSEDDQWADELHQMNADVLASDLEVVPAGTYVDLSDDPDLIEWDLRQQASRCRDIVTVGFPRLKTLLALEYQRAEHEVHAHWAAA